MSSEGQQFQKLIQDTLITNLSSQQTHELLVDEYILQYISTVFQTADYTNKDVLALVIKTVSPIIYNLQLTSTKDEASEIVANIFGVVSENSPSHQQAQLNNPVSALAQLQQREVYEQRYKSLQTNRDLYQQKLNYSVMKQHEKAEQQAAKRIMKGKQSVFQKELDTKIQEITASEAKGALQSGIELQNITLAFGSNVLLKDCTARFSFGHRYCLVARNGAGKSTLLRSIAENEIHCIANREQLKVLYVQQEVPSSDDLVIDVVLSADELYTQLNKLNQLLEAAIDSGDVSEALKIQIRQLLELQPGEQVTEEHVSEAMDVVMQQQLESNAFEKRGKASKILAGLLFTPAMQVKPTKELSGGWKMRVALAKALFSEPDILMLDEPTNNLDLLATLWLEDWLSAFNPRGLLVVVSHDISFIDSFATDVVLLADKKLHFYQGNYTNFAVARQNELLNETREQARQQMQREHIEKFVNRFRYNAKRASLAQSRLKVLNKMVTIELSEERVEQFAFPQPYMDDYEHNHLEPLIELKNVCFQYSTSKLGGFKIQDANLAIFSDSRIALCGANAAGKSTLLKLIAGFLQPSQGEIQRHKNATCAVFWQHHQDQLDLNLTPMETLRQFCPGEQEAAYRAHLSSFGIGPSMINQVNRTLSGGQKTRLSLSLLTFKTNPSILVLDELTNHIDIETKQALIEALQNYNGAVVVVSHDGPFVSSVTDQMFIVDQGKVSEFEGEFDDYKELLKRKWRKQ